MNKIANIVTTAVFLLVIFGFAIWGLIAPDLEKSASENRNLATFPEINMTTVFSKGEDNAMTGFEDYAADHFPARDTFRAIKAWICYNVYGQKVNNGYFKVEDHVGKLEDTINEDSIEHFSQAVQNVYDKYFSNRDNVFYAVVPDKGYFLADKNGYPAMDYGRFLSILADKLPEGIEYIDIMDSLELEDYYYTDIHWSSEKLEDTVKVIAEKMGFLDRLTFDYEVEKLTEDFKGVYYNQAAIPLSPEAMYYITSPIFDDLKVTVDGMPVDSIYNGNYTTDINGFYTYYLHGSKGNIVIENPNAETDKELVLIRDSFGSSIAPWFIEAYSKVTVLDIRYTFPAFLANYVGEDHNTDVLFLYSTSIVNESSAIKK